jgi:uncharacterized protein
VFDVNLADPARWSVRCESAKSGLRIREVDPANPRPCYVLVVITEANAVPRRAQIQIEEALADTPVVVVEGARQVGKSTLVKQVMQDRVGQIVTLDDEQLLAAANLDPASFVQSNRRGTLVIDEIQLAPRLLRAIKAAVDLDRRPGAFLVTGSADLLTLSGAQESLAGRAETVRLYGFSQGELSGGSDSLGDVLLRGDEDRLRELTSTLNRQDYLAIVERGAYPEVQARNPRRRSVWIDNYVSRILSRDASQISNLAHLDRLPKLLSVLAANTSGELVKTRVAADVIMPETTLPPYLDLLESLGLTHRLPPWGRNLRQRVSGRPKLALLDTGIATRLLGLNAAAMHTTAPNASRAGQLLESLAASELRKQCAWGTEPFEIFHFRQRSGREVDLVLETADRRIAGLEIKESSSVDRRDFDGLRQLAEIAGSSFTLGALLYTGGQALRFGPGMWALPISALWQ